MAWPDGRHGGVGGVHDAKRSWRWPGSEPFAPRRRPPRPPTWDQAYGLLLGPLGFLALFAGLQAITSEHLIGLAVFGAGLAGIAVSAVDDRRSDWRARMAWSIGSAAQGAVMLIAPPESAVGQALLTGALGLQAVSALTVLANLRHSRLMTRAITALSAAAPAALVVLALIHSAAQPRWAWGALEAMSLIAFGLLRVARRPRALRLMTR